VSNAHPTGETAAAPRAWVLIVDDHPLFRAGVRQRLAAFSDGIEVVAEAGDGQEAIDGDLVRDDFIEGDIEGEQTARFAA